MKREGGGDDGQQIGGSTVGWPPADEDELGARRYGDRGRRQKHITKHCLPDASYCVWERGEGSSRAGRRGRRLGLCRKSLLAVSVFASFLVLVTLVPVAEDTNVLGEAFFLFFVPTGDAAGGAASVALFPVLVLAAARENLAVEVDGGEGDDEVVLLLAVAVDDAAPVAGAELALLAAESLRTKCPPLLVAGDAVGLAVHAALSVRRELAAMFSVVEGLDCALRQVPPRVAGLVDGDALDLGADQFVRPGGHGLRRALDFVLPLAGVLVEEAVAVFFFLLHCGGGGVEDVELSGAALVSVVVEVGLLVGVGVVGVVPVARRHDDAGLDFHLTARLVVGGAAARLVVIGVAGAGGNDAVVLDQSGGDGVFGAVGSLDDVAGGNAADATIAEILVVGEGVPLLDRRAGATRFARRRPLGVRRVATAHPRGVEAGAGVVRQPKMRGASRDRDENEFGSSQVRHSRRRRHRDLGFARRLVRV
mmetsp:Transcript_28692/g.87822  ORF Transcript_28692/g.87822 Transcript_28692/m.87822 type:complete len:478 (-) Transcript_28692:670-2103(-)